MKRWRITASVMSNIAFTDKAYVPVFKAGAGDVCRTFNGSSPPLATNAASCIKFWTEPKPSVAARCLEVRIGPI
jgi:hypothetical protein